MPPVASRKEDVLLMVKHVRYKKVDGTLYVNSGRVAWRNQTSESFRISAAFEDIRVQRISPDQKEKVQLQLLMHNGESFTFQFADPSGRFKQLEMRNSVKEMLQSLLPKFKDKAQSELGEKYRLLESNPDLLALYKELVVSGILSSEEFWARPEFCKTTTMTSSNDAPGQITDSPHRPPSQRTPTGSESSVTGLPGKPAKQPVGTSSMTSQISHGFQLKDRPQIAGVPSYLLSDIKPEADGVNGIKYNLTHETIDAIFRAYPMVRQRHRELVPDKLSEADFWIKFFQSHYFHKDRVHIPKEDIFAECAGLDERYLQNEVRRTRRGRINAHIDLFSLTDHDLGDGYGIDVTSVNGLPSADSRTTAPADNSAVVSSPTAGNLSTNRLLLRRFNNHSLMVLKSLGSTDIASGLATAPHQPANCNGQTQSQDQAATLMSRIYGLDLQSDAQTPNFRLDLSHVVDYLEGPTTRDQKSKASNVTHANSSHTNRLTGQQPNFSDQQLKLALTKCQNSVQQYRFNRPVMSPLEGQMALADVSSGGCLMGGKSVESFSSHHPHRSVDVVSGSSAMQSDDHRAMVSPSPISERQLAAGSSDRQMDGGPALLNAEQSRELNMLYASASELLRHFWACFPVTNQQLAEKLDRITESLTKFHTTKVAHFAASLSDSSSISNVKLDTSSNANSQSADWSSYRLQATAHLECMLDTAQRKYSDWQSRKRR